MESLASTAGSGNPPGTERFLVCDDERHIARLIQLNLERHGHTVECAFSPREAIDLLEAKTFDRAIIDYGMPEVTGGELVKWIRSQERTRGMWVALIVKHADGLDEADIAEIGADYVARVPFNFKTLLP